MKFILPLTFIALCFLASNTRAQDEPDIGGKRFMAMQTLERKVEALTNQLTDSRITSEARLTRNETKLASIEQLIYWIGAAIGGIFLNGLYQSYQFRQLRNGGNTIELKRGRTGGRS